MRPRWVFIAPAAILGILVFAFIGGGIVQLLWNWLLPTLFGWRLITFWQALGMLALCRILFGRLGGRGFRRSSSWTPEEKQRFREAIGRRWGIGPSAGEGHGQGSPAGGGQG